MGVYGPGQRQQQQVQVLVASLWACLTVGCIYSFGGYSGALQSKFHLSQNQISIVGTANVAVSLFNFTCGLLVDTLGIKFTLILGSTLQAACWFVFGAVAILDTALSHATFVFAALAGGITWGSSCTGAAVFSALVKNFSEERGAAIGIAKAWTGVASGILLSVFVSVLPSEDADPRRLLFLWALAGTVVVLALLPSPMVRVVINSSAVPLKGRTGVEGHALRRQLRLLTFGTLALIVISVAAALLNGSAPRSIQNLFTAMLVTCVFLPGWLLLPGQSRWSGDDRTPAVPMGRCRTALRALGPYEVATSLDGWLLFLVVFALQTGAVLLTTNLGSVAETRSGPPTSVSTLVALVSLSQSIGRLFGGYLSDHLVVQGLARPWFLVGLLVCMSVAQALLCMPGRPALEVGACLAGWAMGASYPAMICSVAELFGTARIASNYMLFDGAPVALGGLVVAKGLAQAVYTMEGQQSQNGQIVCSGDACFRLTFGVTALLQLCACAAGILLAVRAERLYQNVQLQSPEEAGNLSPQAA